ncbi:hypothetical protein [Paraburkholderia bengalensis]|uniref:hypothetical protein n=1 Tax=Paraburkholderia bengalensis TaxID=2747562 RepID=UPI0030155577
MMTAVEKYEPGYHGVFPVTFDRRWHCGIHLVPDTTAEPVRAIADGEVIAYRVSQNPISDGHFDETTGQEALNTNTGFVLLRHVTDTGDGRTLKFYSLYMNLLDLTAQKQLYTPPANPSQNTSPTALAAWLLDAADGVKPGNGKKVYRKDSAWLDENGDGNCVLLTPNPVKDKSNDYEYNLYERATKLYPACPSDGYEMLRFGRILADSPTLNIQNNATWVAVPFDASGTQGYLDISNTSVVKLSDADFPFFTGWRKVDSDNAPLGADGLFSYYKLRQLVGDATATAYETHQDDPQFSLDDQLTYYVQRNDRVRDGLTGFVCHTISEWDPANNDPRYQDLNKPDGYFGQRKDTDPDGYDRFISFVKKLQFMDQVPSLAGGKKLWFFHSLAFIRHFRKCKWIGVQEVEQLLPAKSWLTQSGSTRTLVSNTLTAHDVVARISPHLRDLNRTIRKYSFDSSSERIAIFWLRRISKQTDGRHFLNTAMARQIQTFQWRSTMLHFMGVNYAIDLG